MEYSAGRDIVWRSRRQETPALLVKIITDKSLTSQSAITISARSISSRAPKKMPLCSSC